MLEIINQKNMNFLFEIAKKPRNVSELAKKGDMTLPSASTLISRLSRENVVKKTKSDGDRGREIIITLTEYGTKQVKLLKQIKHNYKENKLLTFEQAKALSLVSEHQNPEFGYVKGTATIPVGPLPIKIITTEKGGEQCKTN